MDVTRANEVAQEMLLNAYNTYRGHGVSWKDVKDKIALLEWLVDLTMDPDNEGLSPNFDTGQITEHHCHLTSHVLAG